MTPPLLAATLALATVAVAAGLGSLLSALGLRLLHAGRVARLGARTRASLLAQLRLAPAVVLLPLTVVVQVAFWRFEPAHGGERVGPLLLLVAGAGMLLAIGSGVGLLRALRATERLRRHWRGAARRIDVPGWPGQAYRVEAEFPVVAVVGVWQPELFVAAGVAAACTPGEIAVVAAHERAHVAALDNLARAAFAATPLPRSLAARLEHAWAAAAEEAADLAARGGGSGVTLASALLKVAGLSMPPTPPQAVLASTLIGVSGLEPRVRRLLAPAPALGRGAWWVSAALTAGLVAASSPVLLQVHRAAEFVVAFGR